MLSEHNPGSGRASFTMLAKMGAGEVGYGTSAWNGKTSTNSASCLTPAIV